MQIQKQLRASAARAYQRRKPGQPWHVKIGATLVSGRARFIALASFVALVALSGGSSRSDIPSLVVLRPASALFLAYALFCVTAEHLRTVRVPLFVVGALMVLALLQLVPLPAAIWTSLPHREVVSETTTLIGMGDLARPLSLDPNRTWNTFFALLVPLTSICLVTIQAPQYRDRTIPLLMAIALLSAIFGLLQAIGGNGLHFYDITHRGYPVGLFANKNHQSILILWLMLAVCWLATTTDWRRLSANVAIGSALATILVLFPLMILTGSRAGLLLTVPALALCCILLFRSPAMASIRRRSAGRAKVVMGGVGAAAVMPLIFVFIALATSNRRTALSRLFEAQSAEEIRWQYMSVFQRMALDFLPFGSGFGSFENVFNSYEFAEMLTSRYMNQAHNDLVQLVIEGGIPALAILLAALAWLVRALLRMWRSPRRNSQALAVFFGGSFALWMAASLVDYPLRTPLAAMLVAALTAQLSFLSSGLLSGPGLPGKRGTRGGVS